MLSTAISGNPNSISDAGVAGEMAHAGAHGASLNILINLKEIHDNNFSKEMIDKTTILLDKTNDSLLKLRGIVQEKINNV